MRLKLGTSQQYYVCLSEEMRLTTILYRIKKWNIVLLTNLI